MVLGMKINNPIIALAFMIVSGVSISVVAALPLGWRFLVVDLWVFQVIRALKK